MKRLSIILSLFAAIVCSTGVAYAGATPSTEGQDFWVTFLRAADDQPTQLKLTISAKLACTVVIENTSTGFRRQQNVGANSSTEIIMNRTDCYSSTNEQATYTALHVTATEDISLFAGNYRDKSFDATNVLPTEALLDDYIVQTYPPSDHDGDSDSQGSHFAIIAVEDGATTVEYNLTTKTAGNKTGLQTVTLQKGQVWYVWTGTGTAGNTGDLSGTTVKAHNGKKIAVFQGCCHTNIPYMVRDRDHIVSQAMPIAYWGTEFGITTSRKHRRDIVAVMALNDGTEVYINDEDGVPQLVHTFNFNSSDPQERKHYWTFEIGEYTAYCADNEGQSPSHGKLPPPVVIDSSCFLTTSCPAGVHLFMVSNRYDNVTERVNSDTLVSDPAMLWISPIEQVIKEINFSTYSTQQAKFHFMNIVTPTANVQNMLWNNTSIAQHFHPLYGNSDYSYARIEIQPGNHNLKGDLGFLAHVYGYGERESYAYSCGSSTIQRSIIVNGYPLFQDSVYPGKFCMGEEISMKLNIGAYNYENVVWDYGDGITKTIGGSASNDEKKSTTHVYDSPGWYDVTASAVYVNQCTGGEFSEDIRFTFYVNRPDTFTLDTCVCASTVTREHPFVFHGHSFYESVTEALVSDENCDTVYKLNLTIDPEPQTPLQTVTGRNYLTLHDTTFYESTQWTWHGKTACALCDSAVTYNINIIQCLEISVDRQAQTECPGKQLPIGYYKSKGNIKSAKLLIDGKTIDMNFTNANGQGFFTGDLTAITPGQYHNAQLIIVDESDECEREAPLPAVSVDVSVLYPTDVFVRKYYNVLAVLNSAYNGGYTFSGYQWYVRNTNDPTSVAHPIEGANEIIYHTDNLGMGYAYSVYLLNGGTWTMSCERVITDMNADSEPTPRAPEVRKMVKDQQLFIEVDGVMYDSMGNRVE